MARTNSRPLTFQLNAPQAKRVSLAGSFNSWNTKSHLAKKDTKGNWSLKVNLKPGKYEYKFFIDGNWVNDPSCRGCIANPFGTQNCVVEVR